VTGLQIIGPDEEEAGGVGCVGVDGNDGDAGAVCGTDSFGDGSGVGCGDEDAGWIGADSGVKCVFFALGIVGVRAFDPCGDVVVEGSLVETGLDRFPVRQFQVGGYKDVVGGCRGREELKSGLACA
jgi:hypothetical protein